MDFEYILRNVPTSSEIDLDDFEDNFQGCSCLEECTLESGCSCLRQAENNYGPDGSFLHSSKSSLPHLECFENCTCALNENPCRNRRVQFGVQCKLKVVPVPGKGLGVVAAEEIKAGTFVAEYVGEVLTREEAVERAKNRAPEDHNYIFTVDEFVQGERKTTYIDARRRGNIARFINHGCEPNLFPQVIRFGRVSPCLALFSLCDISVGEELCYSYGPVDPSSLLSSESGTSAPPKRCLCGAPTCSFSLPNAAF